MGCDVVCGKLLFKGFSAVKQLAMGMNGKNDLSWPSREVVSTGCEQQLTNVVRDSYIISLL